MRGDIVEKYINIRLGAEYSIRRFYRNKYTSEAKMRCKIGSEDKGESNFEITKKRNIQSKKHRKLGRVSKCHIQK